MLFGETGNIKWSLELRRNVFSVRYELNFKLHMVTQINLLIIAT
jgi:hypothetical protein